MDGTVSYLEKIPMATLGKFTATEANSEDWALLNPTHTEHDKFKTQHILTDSVLQLTTHTTTSTTLWMPHPSLAMHKGLHISETDDII